MTIEYMTDNGLLKVEHVERCDVRRWALEHPSVTILHAVPDAHEADD